MVLLILFFGGVLLTAGDVCMKKWVISNNYNHFIYGMIYYIVGMLFLAYSFKFKNIATASAIFVVFNIVTLIIFSFIMFKEPISNRQLIGIGIVILGIFLIEI